MCSHKPQIGFRTSKSSNLYSLTMFTTMPTHVKHHWYSLTNPPLTFGQNFLKVKKFCLWVKTDMISLQIVDACTTYSKTSLLCQLVASLCMCFALQKLYRIPDQTGRIMNMIMDIHSMSFHSILLTKSNLLRGTRRRETAKLIISQSVILKK